MIIDGLVNIVFGFIDILLLPLQVINISFDIEKIAPILQYFRMALYIIPFQELSPIFTIFVALMAFRIIVSLIKTIWNLLPIL